MRARQTTDQDDKIAWSAPVKTVNPGPARSCNQGNQRPEKTP